MDAFLCLFSYLCIGRGNYFTKQSGPIHEERRSSLQKSARLLKIVIELKHSVSTTMIYQLLLRIILMC